VLTSRGTCAAHRIDECECDGVADSIHNHKLDVISDDETTATLAPMEPADASTAVVAPPRVHLGMYEGLREQMSRMDALRVIDSDAVQSMLQLGGDLVSLAAAGDADAIDARLDAVQQSDILYWFTTKMLLAACANGRASVVSALSALVVACAADHQCLFVRCR
jgi:hypothetical protein